MPSSAGGWERRRGGLPERPWGHSGGATGDSSECVRPSTIRAQNVEFPAEFPVLAVSCPVRGRLSARRRAGSREGRSGQEEAARTGSAQQQQHALPDQGPKPERECRDQRNGDDPGQPDGTPGPGMMHPERAARRRMPGAAVGRAALASCRLPGLSRRLGGAALPAHLKKRFQRHVPAAVAQHTHVPVLSLRATRHALACPLPSVRHNFADFH